MTDCRHIVFVLILLFGGITSAHGENALIFINHSDHDIKAVAPGTGFVLKANSPQQKIVFKSTDPLGVQLNIWWKKNPRELCQLFTPWNRYVHISGTGHIQCYSKDK